MTWASPTEISGSVVWVTNTGSKHSFSEGEDWASHLSATARLKILCQVGSGRKLWQTTELLRCLYHCLLYALSSWSVGISLTEEDKREHVQRKTENVLIYSTNICGTPPSVWGHWGVPR